MTMYLQGSGAGRNALTTLFDREHLFEPAERHQPRAWDDMQDAEEITPGGRGVTYQVIGNVGYGVGAPSEGGDYSVARTMDNVDLTTTSAQLDGVIQLSDKYINAAKDDGSFYGDAMAQAVIENTLQYYTWCDIVLGPGYGTFQLASVNGAVVTNTVVQCDTDEWNFQLRRGMTVEFRFGGSQEHTAKLVSVDYKTGRIELDAAGTISDGAGIYLDDTYGKTAPNGLRSIVDNGDLAPTIDGGVRADYPYLDCISIGTAGAGADDFTEEALDELLDNVTWEQDFVPTELRLNNGLFRAWKKITRNDRMMTLPGKGAVTADGGTKGEAPAFFYGDGKIPFRLDRNWPGRTVHAIYRPGLRRNILRKPDWFSEKGGPMFDKVPGDNGVGWKYAFVGSILGDINVSSRKYNSSGRRLGFKDPAFGDV